MTYEQSGTIATLRLWERDQTTLDTFWPKTEHYF